MREKSHPFQRSAPDPGARRPDLDVDRSRRPLERRGPDRRAQFEDTFTWLLIAVFGVVVIVGPWLA